jgi:lipoate-protein ligase A
MAMLECRLLPAADADGPHNMAADEALLDSATAGVASLRFYGWTVPTLTLGYFQSAAVRRTACLAGLPWVRRPSGGAALVHHREITYALALPAGPPWQHRCESWIRQIHLVIQSALASFGIESRLCTASEGRKLAEVLCFLHHTTDDLLIGTAKIAGSAQRKHRGAIVQHGGILLAGSAVTPELPGIAELTGDTLSPNQVSASVIEALGRRHGWALVAADWTVPERRRIEELATEKYLSPSWNEKR